MELLAIRTRLGWSQSALARRIGVAPRTVARWEQGVHPVDPLSARLLLILRDQADISPAKEPK